MDPIKTGRLIADLRKRKEMTQTELARNLNISNRTVSKWENGDGMPDISLLEDIAVLLDITVDELLKGESISVDDDATPCPEFHFSDLDDKASFVKMYKYIHRQKFPLWFHILAIVCFGIMLPFSLSLNDTFFVVLVIAEALLIFDCFIPYINSAVKVAEIKMYNGNVFPDGTLIVSDKLYLTRGVQTMIFDLADVTEFREWKNTYFFRINKSVFLSVGKDRLVDATNEEFEAYINSVINRRERTSVHKVITIICSALLVLDTIAFSLLGILVAGNESDSQKYIDMPITEVCQLDEIDLYEAVSYRINDKIVYSDEGVADYTALSQEELNFNYAFNYYYAVSDAGLFEYLYNYADEAQYLYGALCSVGMNDLADQYMRFIINNDIDFEQYLDDDFDYEKESSAYPYDEYDKATGDMSRDIISSLVEYVKNNPTMFD